MQRILKWALAALIVLVIAPGARAQSEGAQPLVELGVFGAGGTFPDYPASGQNHLHFLPLPYVIYRGEYLQLGQNSIRGIIVNTPRLSLDVSASAAFNTSNNDTARQGMPKLDYLGELGPRLNILLAHDAGAAKLDLELPVRAVFSTNLSSIAYRGFVLAPELAYTHDNFMNSGGRLKIGIGPEAATGRLMEYFYDVEPQFVIPGRAQYTARGGYLGSRAEVTFRLPLNQRLTVFTLVAPEWYTGATNSGSPLFKQQYSVSAALGLAFSFYRSDATAQGATDE